MATLKINGFTATVLNESRSGGIRHADGEFEELEVPTINGRIDGKWLAALLERAKAANAERVMMTHSRHVSYELRSSMRTRSGNYEVLTIYAKENGWKAKRSIQNGIY